MVDSHAKSKEHIDAAFKAKNFTSICSKNEQSIMEFGSNAYRNKVTKNRKIMTSIIGAVVLCGRQNIALRGKTEYRSNFKTILNYRAEKDDVLSVHLVTAPKHAKYLSPKVQNEFISLSGIIFQAK